MKNLFKLIIILCIGYGSYFGIVNDEGEKIIDMTNEEQQTEQQSQNNTTENLVQEPQNENEQKQKSTAEIEDKTQIEKNEEKQENKVTQTTNEKNNSTSTKSNKEIKKVEQNQTKEINTSNANVNRVQNTEKQNESDEQQTENKKETKYIKNDSMIQKIKATIENNVTEDMKKYGYKIVVDSSIKELTNQFTFPESRVKNSIKYSFGTIRIYAEDYYSNGQLIMTECYIL